MRAKERGEGKEERREERREERGTCDSTTAVSLLL